MSSVVPNNAGIYYSGVYWNDFEPVLRYMSRCFTGDPAKTWEEDFKERFAAKPFKNALFLNCGNGRVERQFFEMGIVEKATAFDYAADLIAEASAARGELDITYFQADANLLDLETDQFDLVVNVAALHHVQMLNRLSRILCGAMKSGGILVNFEYVGPARNQYGAEQWRLIQEVNASLPEKIRHGNLGMPHLPTMMVTDPTEAIHSDQILGVQARYFDIFERHDTGGGIAYQLLTHNPKLPEVPVSELPGLLEPLLELDWRYTQEGRVPPMFSYFLARPRKEALANRVRIWQYNVQEATREELARRRRGVYSWRQYFELQAHARANRR